MLTYFIKKLCLAIPLLFGVISLIFLLVELSPGDATDRFFTPDTPPEVRTMIEQKWGLDKPAPTRYILTVKNLLTGHFGHSIFQERPVFDIIKEAIIPTLMLSALSLILIQGFGILIGLLQAIKQYSLTDSTLGFTTLFFYSMPSFWLALMLQLLLTLYYPILPTSGMIDPVMHDDMSALGQAFDILKHLFLPAISLAIVSVGGIARYMRASVLEVLKCDYIRTAKAKGLKNNQIVFKHVLKNALLPIITIFGLQLPFLFSGSVLIETIYAWPGMGRLIVSAIFTQDTPVIIACFFVFTLLVVLGNLLADLCYALVDPRIRLS